MQGVYVTIYNLLLSVFGTLENQPEKLTKSMYWLSWVIVTMFLAFIIYLIFLGVITIIETLSVNKEKSKKVKIYHYRSKRG